jgi:hypothetical protein
MPDDIAKRIARFIKPFRVRGIAVPDLTTTVLTLTLARRGADSRLAEARAGDRAIACPPPGRCSPAPSLARSR